MLIKFGGFLPVLSAEGYSRQRALSDTDTASARIVEHRQTKADFEHLEDILHPANARHTICHTTRVNLAKPCYSDTPLTSFALDAIPEYDFRFARKTFERMYGRTCWPIWPRIQTVPNKNAGQSAAVCSDGCPTWCGHGCTTDAQLVIAPAAAGTAHPGCRGRSVRTQCSQPG